MKKFSLLILIMGLSTFAFASDNCCHKKLVVKKSSVTQCYHKKLTAKKSAIPVSVNQQTSAGYCATITPGSLRGNVVRIGKQYGWRQVVWKSPKEFRWVGSARICADNFSGVMTKLLDAYPLQAVFYEGNHVLVIQPRTIK